MARHKASQLRIAFSYVFDYLLCFILAGVWSYIATLEPNYSRFSLTDITLQYPIADPETFPFGLAAFLSIGVPAIIIVLWSLIVDYMRYRLPLKSRLWEINAGILGLFLSEAITLVITTSLKGIVGRPRPDSIARCLPREGSVDATPFGLSTIAICTQLDREILAEGFRSWPSGHSSTAFAGLAYLSLYLAGKLTMYDNKGEVWKATVVMFPALGAAAIATSRVKDHRHHGTDVLTGSIIGFVVAWMSYRLYFPSLADTMRQGRAWSIRSWGETKVSPEIEDRDSDLGDVENLNISARGFRRRQTTRDESFEYDPIYAPSGAASAGIPVARMQDYNAEYEDD